MAQARSEEIFRLDPDFQGVFQKALFSVVKKPLSRILCLSRLNDIYSTAHGDPRVRSLKGGDLQSVFNDTVLDRLGIEFDLPCEELARIPSSGPAVVVANHPFGAIEGLILARILKAVRPDVKIMANYILGLIPELRDMFFRVDPFGTDTSYRRNIGPLKDSIRHVKKGGMLGVFPAGEVSSVHLKKRMVLDPAWSPTVGRMLKIARAQAIPIYFDGRNGAMFQLLGLIHPRLRTMMLPRENLSRADKKPVRVAVGAPVPWEKLASFSSDEEIISYLRFRTYLLGQRAKGVTEKKKRKIIPIGKRHKPLARARGRRPLVRAIQDMDSKDLLLEQGPFSVFECGAHDVPGLLHELGRMRERTFRQVGEGTGAALDTDDFDHYYRHLILWDRENRRMAGSYRMGPMDDILETQGIKGAYTSTLFKMSPGFFERTRPALELGRSFVCPEYQKSYSALMLLWKGLARYIAREARFSTLFGPVSISADYHPVSRDLLMESVRRHHGHPDLAPHARPRLAPRLASIKRVDQSIPEIALADPAEAGICVSEIEPGKTVPVLLRQYLKLGGQIVDFNVDPNFGNCVDGLIVVDLKRTDPKVLSRFMGKKESARYLQRMA